MNTQSNPLVSIIIPTYNHAKFISKALKSVIEQTYKNWEAIIIDNESIDETYKIINSFNDPRLKYFKIFNDGVIAKSRNLGIKEARGDWIAFLDSDDWWTKDKLEVCISKINENVDFIYHAHEYVNEFRSFLKKKLIKGRKLKKPILNDLLIGTITKGTQISNSSVIVRKNILYEIGGLNESKILVGSDDYDTWLRIAQITDQFLYVNKKLSYYLYHGENTSNKDKSITHRLVVKDFMHLFNNQQKLNLEVKLRYMSGDYNYKNNNYEKSKKDFKFVIKYGFLHLKLRSLLKIVFMTLGLKKFSI